LTIISSFIAAIMMERLPDIFDWDYAY